MRELQNRKLIETQQAANKAGGPIQNTQLVDVLNPANKGLGAINDILRMIGEETMSDVAANPTNFARDVPNEMVAGAPSVEALAKGLISGGSFEQLPRLAAMGGSLPPLSGDYDAIKAEQEARIGELKQLAPQSFAAGERTGEIIGGPGMAGEKLLFKPLGKVLGMAGKLVGDLELGGRKLGETFNKLLPKVRNIDEAYDVAASKIKATAEARDKIIAAYDKTRAVSLPGGKNGMSLTDLEGLADDYIKAGDRAAGEDLLKIAVDVENGQLLTRSQAIKLKTAINHEVYLPSGNMRNTKSAKVMERWAEDLRKNAIDSIPNSNDRLRVLQADKDMTDLYTLRGKIEKAQQRPISISLSGAAKATVGRPSIFNALQNAGRTLQGPGASGAARVIAPAINQVFEEQSPPIP